jgi:hypothetical protein
VGKAQTKKQVNAVWGTGSSISGKIFRDHVGKNPLAAGAGSDLPRLLAQG